ncbi:Uncharacterised protein [Escherichia coli]|nr:Uncharacterised protein [Escherichia coli]
MEQVVIVDAIRTPDGPFRRAVLFVTCVQKISPLI